MPTRIAPGNTLAIGLMSGTSMDGVDAALLLTDGQASLQRFPDAAAFVPYTPVQRELLQGALSTAAQWHTLLERDGFRPGLPEFTMTEAIVESGHIKAVEAVLAAAQLSSHDIGVIGFHGQTVLHRPDRGLTVQIGSPAKVASKTGIACMADLRQNDIRNGGQGAPLVPAYHAALATQLSYDEPVAVVNVGGVANITWLPAGDLATKLAGMCAFDVGPGNALLDEFIFASTGSAYDEGGAIAARGLVNQAALEACLQHPFFLAPAPKSLDRRDFHRLPALQTLLHTADLEGGAATLTALTANAIALSELHLPGGLGATGQWIITGGGARNRTLLSQVTALLARNRAGQPLRVRTADACGWSSSHLEAEAFAYLAVRAERGLPLTWPATTGASAPLGGGVYYPA